LEASEEERIGRLGDLEEEESPDQDEEEKETGQETGEILKHVQKKDKHFECILSLCHHMTPPSNRSRTIRTAKAAASNGDSAVISLA